ncbi:MAG: pyruvate, water dikinase regulatory protein [Cyanobacteriota bacterium]
MGKKNELTVFTMSDGTGQTAEAVALAAIRQFLPEEIKIVQECLPRIVNTQQISQIISAMTVYQPCIIVYTVVVPEFREKIRKEAEKYNIYTVDLINPIIDRISEMLGKKPRLESGLNQLLDEKYFKKIEAIEFAIKFDDGKDPKGVMEADVILVGVSRTSKTPTCMYLAQHKGIKAGNIPLVQGMMPPKELFSIPPEKIIGLTILPENLLGIRTSRLESLGLPNGSDYADFGKIIDELEYAEGIMKRLKCRMLDVSKKAIEETAVDIVHLLGKNKK